jgi:hypothetical protein
MLEGSCQRGAGFPNCLGDRRLPGLRGGATGAATVLPAGHPVRGPLGGRPSKSPQLLPGRAVVRVVMVSESSGIRLGGPARWIGICVVRTAPRITAFRPRAPLPRGAIATVNPTAAPPGASSGAPLRARRGDRGFSWRRPGVPQPRPQTRRPTIGSASRRRGGRSCGFPPPDRRRGARSFRRRSIRS